MKYKVNQGRELVVCGYTPGNPFDAIIVGYYKDANLLYAEKVRAGFVHHVRRELVAVDWSRGKRHKGETKFDAVSDLQSSNTDGHAITSNRRNPLVIRSTE